MANSPIMNLMIRAAEKASRALLRDFNEVEQLQVSRKGPADFVTAADKRSEKILFEELQKIRPDYSFMMEESGQVKGNDPDHVWIIDPLDGTANFAAGKGPFGILVALAEHGETIGGWIYDPLSNRFISAYSGEGTIVDGTRIHSRTSCSLSAYIMSVPSKFGTAPSSRPGLAVPRSPSGP